MRSTFKKSLLTGMFLSTALSGSFSFSADTNSGEQRTCSGFECMIEDLLGPLINNVQESYGRPYRPRSGCGYYGTGTNRTGDYRCGNNVSNSPAPAPTGYPEYNPTTTTYPPSEESDVEQINNANNRAQGELNQGRDEGNAELDQRTQEAASQLANNTLLDPSLREEELQAMGEIAQRYIEQYGAEAFANYSGAQTEVINGILYYLGEPVIADWGGNGNDVRPGIYHPRDVLSAQHCARLSERPNYWGTANAGQDPSYHDFELPANYSRYLHDYDTSYGGPTASQLAQSHGASYRGRTIPYSTTRTFVDQSDPANAGYGPTIRTDNPPPGRTITQAQRQIYQSSETPVYTDPNDNQLHANAPVINVGGTDRTYGPRWNGSNRDSNGNPVLSPATNPLPVSITGPVGGDNSVTITDGVQLSNPDGPCLTISGVDRVVIDTAMLGPCAGPGIVIDGATEVIITNSNFELVDEGIVITNSSNITIANNGFKDMMGTSPNGQAIDITNATGGLAIVDNAIQNSGMLNSNPGDAIVLNNVTPSATSNNNANVLQYQNRTDSNGNPTDQVSPIIANNQIFSRVGSSCALDINNSGSNSEPINVIDNTFVMQISNCGLQQTSSTVNTSINPQNPNLNSNTTSNVIGRSDQLDYNLVPSCYAPWNLDPALQELWGVQNGNGLILDRDALSGQSFYRAPQTAAERAQTPDRYDAGAAEYQYYWRYYWNYDPALGLPSP